MTTNLERLKHIVLKRSFKYCEEPTFKLASGSMSRFYFDCKKTTLDPEGAYLIGEILYDLVKDTDIKGVGGLTLGADPISSALMHSAWRRDKRRIYQFVVRKELKDHGSIKRIEGNIQKNDPVLIVDDVVTTGGSTVQALQMAKEDGLTVKGVAVLVDREEFDGMDRIRNEEPKAWLQAIITRSDIMALRNASAHNNTGSQGHVECSAAAQSG
jgi:orotate phosphoribosyltransferase